MRQYITEEDKNEPKDPDLWDEVIKLTKGEIDSITRTVDGEEVTVDAPNDGAGFDVYPCVTRDAEALTPGGWKQRSELSEGDAVYAYNRARDVVETVPIKRFHDYEDAEVIRVESRGFNYGFTCTPGHRVVRLSESDNWQDEVEETEERLVAASQIAGGDMTYREAREAGHSNMQGFVRRYGGMALMEALDEKRNSVPQTRRIDEVLDSKSQDRVLVAAKAADASTVDWNDPYVKYETDPVQRVLAMSYGERMAFLQASVMCDGCLLNNNESVSHSFIQKNEENKEAVRLAAFLTGHMVTESDKGNGCSTLCIKTRPHIGNRGLEAEPVGVADVWCPETEHGTWLMRQGGTVTITGNSAYANGWAVQRYEELGGEWKSVDESAYVQAARIIAEGPEDGLDQWFDEKWVDITEPKNDDGEYPACGASSEDEEREKDPRKNYPKCVPKSKVDKLTDKEIEKLARKKQKAVDSADSDSESDDGDSDKPVRTDTDSAVEDSYKPLARAMTEDAPVGKEYCKNTPVEEMGFTQKASCKAQGYIARSDGEKRKSPKYEMTETELRQIVRKKLTEDVSGARWGILAPESADYEILRYEEGSTDKEAMNNLMDWARNNGFEIDTGSPNASSYWDYRFVRGGNELAPTRLQ